MRRWCARCIRSRQRALVGEAHQEALPFTDALNFDCDRVNGLLDLIEPVVHRWITRSANALQLSHAFRVSERHASKQCGEGEGEHDYEREKLGLVHRAPMFKGVHGRAAGLLCLRAFTVRCFVSEGGRTGIRLLAMR